MALVVPDAGRFAEVEGSCDGAWLGRLLDGFVPGLVRLQMPPWKFRVKAELKEVLAALGRATEDRKVVVDRPFLFVVHDMATATPLFIDPVTDLRAS